NTEDDLRIFISKYSQHQNAPEARYLLGQLLEKKKDYTEAARVYRNLDLLHAKSDYAEKAFDRLENMAKKKLLAGYEAPAATIYNLGIKYFSAANYVKAKGYFTRLTKFYTKSTFYDEAVMMLGRIALRKNSLSQAETYFKQARNLDQDSKAEAMYYLGLTYMYQDKDDMMVVTLEKLAELFPNNHWGAEALYYLGQHHRKQGDIKLALSAFDRLTTSYPDSEQQARAIWQIGNIFYKSGDYKKASDSFNLALKPDPKKASDKNLFWAAKSLAKLGDQKNAIEIYKTTVAVHDHTYYGYRAREELRKYGITLKIATVPEVSELIEKINGSTYDLAGHEQKYQELLAVGLGDEAAGEAEFLETEAPDNEKNQASLAKYHAYVMKGKFAQPIHFADQKLDEAMAAGTLDQADPRLWRFAYPRGYWQYVDKYAKEYGLDPYLVYAVIREESRFKERALSRSYAHGLMQIIPSTGQLIANALGLRYSRWNMYQPRVNIQMGCYYLAETIKRFDGNVSLALAGYNGGPNRVKRWLKNYPQFDLDEFVEDIPLTETRNYVKKVMKSYYGYKRVYGGS
ncbi:MAG: transglycosylase SLT domain-containing protein, partial [bacterium]